MYGKFASYSGTSVTGENIKETQWATKTDDVIFTPDKLTFIADSLTYIKINESENWQSLYLDPNDLKYKISFDSGDLKINHFETNTAVSYFVAFIY
jgi:hypothetical protein